MLRSCNWRVAGVAGMLAAGLMLSAALRLYNLRSDHPSALSDYSTAIYIGTTVFAAILLLRLGVPLQRLGFGPVFQPGRVLLLAAIGVGLLQVVGAALAPLSEQLFGAGRNLARFADISGDSNALFKLMLLNWTVAAFGEELAFRIVLMRGIAFALGDSRRAFAIALIAQAVLFGLVHAYQGPAGMLGSGVNGLVFGAVTLAGRGSIWPAALAHGANNSIGILQLYLSG